MPLKAQEEKKYPSSVLMPARRNRPLSEKMAVIKPASFSSPRNWGKTCVEAVESTLSGETLENEIGVEVGVYTADGIVYASDLEQ